MLRVKPSAADKLESARSRTPQTRQFKIDTEQIDPDCRARSTTSPPAEKSQQTTWTFRQPTASAHTLSQCCHN
jgi:hypothetical protein